MHAHCKMSGSNRLNKIFGSLDKRRRGLGGPVHPISRLDDTSKTTIRNKKSYSVPGTSEEDLEEIFGEESSPRSDQSFGGQGAKNGDGNEVGILREQKVEGDRLEDNKAKEEISDSLNGNTFNESALFFVPLNSFRYNDQTYDASSEDDLALSISADNKKMIFTIKAHEVLSIDRYFDFKSITFSSSKHIILIEFSDGISYVWLDTVHDDQKLFSYIKTTKLWHMSSPNRILHGILDDHINALQRKFKLRQGLRGRKDITPDRKASKGNIQRLYGSSKRQNGTLGSIAGPSKNGRITRSTGFLNSNINLPRNTEEQTDSFEIELKHTFKDNKVFTITKADFKTLYNNEWINDTLIDFFIKDEMERAIYERKLFKHNEIYSFNSFFFPKLMTGGRPEDPQRYYRNVKKWLSKLDLTSYNYVILPINENLHWYCAIIKGLPKLLNANSESEKEKSLDPSEDSKDEAKYLLEGKLDKKPNNVEIFIFDSLCQKHSNIYLPLKQLIIDYCDDRHKLKVDKSSIRIYSAKVPKQNNFNDCGIHVIYNVRKWLNNHEQCERIWKSPNLKTAFRMLFVADERNKMRKELREKLLLLMKCQLRDRGRGKNGKENVSDDDIEVIEYLPDSKLKSADERELVSTNLAKFNAKSQSSQKSKTLEVPHTLDPWTADGDSSDKISFKVMNRPWEKCLSDLINNKQVKDKLQGQYLPLVFIDYLNHHYLRSQRFDSYEMGKIVSLEDSISAVDKSNDRELLRQLLDRVTSELRAYRRKKISSELRPKDEILVIKHSNESEELGECVKRLSISQEGSGDSEILESMPNEHHPVEEDLTGSPDESLKSEEENKTEKLSKHVSCKRRKISKE